MPFHGAIQPIHLHLLLTLAIVLVVFGADKLGQAIRSLIARSGV